MQWICVVPGEVSRPLTDLYEHDAASAALAADLLQEGFRSYVKTARPALELASICVAQLETQRGHPVRDVDAVIVACEDFDDLTNEVDQSRPSYRTWLNEIVAWMAANGLGNAYPYGNWLAGCGNMTSALSLARSLIIGGVHRRVLVTVMSVFRRGMTRGVHRTGSSVLSDAVACCLVSAEPDSGACYRIDGIHVTADAKLSTINRATDEIRYLFTFERGVRRAQQGAEVAFTKSLNAFDHVLVPNLSNRVLSASLDILRIPYQYPRRGLYPEIAHTGAPDHFFALLELQGSGDVKHGQAILLFNPGLFCWDFVALTSFL